ncbi:MAG: ATP-binding cassette domain-containing protein, partial [Chthoniobacteraceae bacterium]
MLELQDLSLQVGSEADEHFLLAETSLRLPRSHLAAILGPSGCGKSTLLKVIAGITEQTVGKVKWEGRDLSEEADLEPHEIGYVPQFSIAFERLTVWENLATALQLRVAGLPAELADQRIERVLEEVGLADIPEREVRLLSGGQRRRLALALEILSSPHLLLCDEVTSGLDPSSEDEIVALLRELSREESRTVLNVTHSVRNLQMHDSVLVLYRGHVAYHGAPDSLLHYFGVVEADDLFPKLALRAPKEWHRSWIKHRTPYYAACGLDQEADGHPPSLPSEEHANEPAESESKADEAPVPPPAVEPVRLPSLVAQVFTLLGRRKKLFFRDRGQLALQVALLFGFPILVIIFALGGLPQLPNPSGTDSQSFIAQMMSDVARRKQFIEAGTLVSGLVMFQVILLALMGSNNSAREVAGERMIFEKEKFAGLRPAAYVMSKAIYLGVLVCAQSLWMAAFVGWFVKFPGDFAAQAALLILVNAAMTAVCLGLSSVLKTAEQSSLVSIYLVGFQLPLSGALLALPAGLGTIARPFIASYWSWSGFLDTMRATRLFDA